MRAQVTIPKYYKEAWDYLVKIKVKPQNLILEGGLNYMYEKARQYKYISRQSNEENIPF